MFSVKFLKHDLSQSSQVYIATGEKLRFTETKSALCVHEYYKNNDYVALAHYHLYVMNEAPSA